MKKFVVLAMLLATSAWAQKRADFAPPACAGNNISFNVKLDDSATTLAQPAPGKALVFFIHESGSGWAIGYPTTRFALDGNWVGADHGDSWFSISVDPGEHHLCADLQSSIVNNRSEFAHFQAEPGKVYYFRTRLTLSRTVELLSLEPIDSDEGRYLVQTFPLSRSTPKK